MLSDRPTSFLKRHGVTRTVILRLVVVISLLLVIGIRFERTFVAVAISLALLVVFVLLSPGEE